MIETYLMAGNRAFCRVSGLICLSLFLALQVFAVSETLHRALHAESGTPEHRCAVTALTNGQVDPALPGALWITADAGFLLLLPPLDDAAVLASDYRLPQGRAPPLS